MMNSTCLRWPDPNTADFRQSSGGRAIGRPAITAATRDAIRRLLGAGQSERAIVQQLGVSKGAVGRYGRCRAPAG
jgi:hypothetical protein